MPAPLIAAAAAPAVSAAAGGGAVAAGGTAVAASSGSAAASSAAVAAKGSNIAAGVKGGASGSSGMAGKITAAPKVKIAPGKMSPLKNASSPTPSKTAPNVKTKNQIQQYKEKKQLEQDQQKPTEKTSKNEKDRKTKDEAKEPEKEKEKDQKNKDFDENDTENEDMEEEDIEEKYSSPKKENKFEFWFIMSISVIKDLLEIFLTASGVGLLFVNIVSFPFTLILSIWLFASGQRGMSRMVNYFLSLMLDQFAPGVITFLPITSIATFIMLKFGNTNTQSVDKKDVSKVLKTVQRFIKK